MVQNEKLKLTEAKNKTNFNVNHSSYKKDNEENGQSTSMNDNHKDKSNNKIKKKYKEKEKNEIIDENKDEDENSMTNLEEGYESQLVGFLDDVELCQIYDKKVVSSSNLTTTDLLNVHPFASREWERWDGGKVGGKPVWLNPENLPKSNRDFDL